MREVGVVLDSLYTVFDIEALVGKQSKRDNSYRKYFIVLFIKCEASKADIISQTCFNPTYNEYLSLVEQDKNKTIKQSINNQVKMIYKQVSIVILSCYE